MWGLVSLLEEVEESRSPVGMLGRYELFGYIVHHTSVFRNSKTQRLKLKKRPQCICTSILSKLSSIGTGSDGFLYIQWHT